MDNASSLPSVAYVRRRIASVRAARAEESNRVERLLESVADSVTDIDEDSWRLELERDIIFAIVRSEWNEVITEVVRLKGSLEMLKREVFRHWERKMADDMEMLTLKFTIGRLAEEKNILEVEKDESNAKITELGGKVVSLERVLEEKNEELEEVKLEMAAILEANVTAYETRGEVENENMPAVDGGAEQVRGEGHGAAGVAVPWIRMAAWMGAVAAVLAASYGFRHHAKRR